MLRHEGVAGEGEGKDDAENDENRVRNGKYFYCYNT